MKILKVIKAEDTIELCEECEGAGYLWIVANAETRQKMKVTCETCEGSGRVIEATFEATGKLPITKVRYE